MTKAVIDSKEEFNVLYSENTGMALGAVTALDSAGISHGVGKDVIVIAFDCDRWAMQKLVDGEWNFIQQCSPFQAEVIDGMIKTLQAGGQIEGLNEKGQIINEELGFDARTITPEDVDKYSWNADAPEIAE